jgi:hypothetical protein
MWSTISSSNAQIGDPSAWRKLSAWLRGVSLETDRAARRSSFSRQALCPHSGMASCCSGFSLSRKNELTGFNRGEQGLD